ncbi:MAG: YidC/Oxa1 family membrane protein insertase [Candidatus Daviesbacteria bacterium]|nr:YidC/Oxa1 family membrane protein insertase [Candidatus Daviesbacteria bacterium]
MQVITDIFNTFFMGPILNLLVLILDGLNFLHIPGAFGLSIIILTILIRILVWPLMTKQLKSAKKMQDLKPHLDALKVKHKGDKKAFAAAQMDLYKQHGVNPAGGCLPVLIQFPVLIALYQTIFAFFNGPTGLVQINNMLYPFVPHLKTVPSLDFLGISLAVKPSEFSQYGFLLLAIPLITALLTFFQSKMMMPPKPLKEYPADSPKEKKDKVSTEDAMGAMQGQMMYMMPVMIGYFAFQFPIGLALYWNTMTILGIYQQYKVSGWGGMESWVKIIKK